MQNIILYLQYNPFNYTPIAQKAISDYIESVRFATEMSYNTSVTPDYIAHLDRERSLAHTRLGALLAEEGIMPNDKLGRCLGRLILITQGLETFEGASESDVKRAQRTTTRDESNS